MATDEAAETWKEKDMKAFKTLLISAAIAGTMGSVFIANAQYTPIGGDGLAASPKVRQNLNDHKVTPVVEVSRETVRSVSYQAIGTDGIAASPRVRQAINEHQGRATAPALSTEVASVGYRATGPDGITASPRVRQQLNEHPAVMMVARVK